MGHRRILFISHDSRRTGAPFVLLHLLRWFHENRRTGFSIVLKEGGALEPEFRALGPVLVHTPPPGPKPTRVQRIYRRLFVPPDAPAKRLLAWARRQDVGLVYSSTTENGALLEALSPLGCPVVSHLHELEYWIRRHTGPVRTRQLLAHTTRFVAGSEAVRRNLIANHGVSEERVSIVPESIPVAEWKRSCADGSAGGAEIRDSLGIGRDELVVGGAGTNDWRKAPDVFIQTARIFQNRRPELPVHFVWVGGDLEGVDHARLMHDVSLAGLAGKVHFLGARKDYLKVLASFDLFALVSREDSFPLVMLEAALLKKPVVCFAGAGGGPEFVGDDAGVVVPYFDLDALCSTISNLLDSPSRRIELGEAGKRKVETRHDVAVVGPEFARNIEQLMPNDSATRPGLG